MDDKELTTLNRKLASFAGFINEYSYDEDGLPIIKYYYPNSEVLEPYTVIDLVNDQNTQLKWIYPKLAELKCCLKYKKDFSIPQQPHQWMISGNGYRRHDGVDLDSTTLAFALAVEKFFDYLESKNGR